MMIFMILCFLMTPVYLFMGESLMASNLGRITIGGKEQCGHSYGTNAETGSFPWVAYLKSVNPFEVRYCSGSLIHPNWVLTSAGCTFESAKVEVTLGAIIPNNKNDPNKQVIKSDAVFINPNYKDSGKVLLNDLALIRLRKKVTITDAIMPIPINEETLPKYYSKIVFAAWAETGNETLSFNNHMIVKKGACECFNSDLNPNEQDNPQYSTSDELLCVMMWNNFCFLHKGGGLIVDGRLVAVMSGRCFTHCRHHEGTFYNIENHVEWIQATLNSKGTTDQNVYRDCSDVSEYESGIYFIQPNDDTITVAVYCEVRLESKKWTVLLQRVDDSVDFYRDYETYKHNFGNLLGNHWIGLEAMHQITKYGGYELYVELEAFNGSTAFARYSSFSVGDVKSGYRLSISGYDQTSTAGDSMTCDCDHDLRNLNGMKFTTYDKKQRSMRGSQNCAVTHKGAWWYNFCMHSQLTGPYHNTAVESNTRSIYWYHWFGNQVALKYARMLIRKK